MDATNGAHSVARMSLACAFALALSPQVAIEVYLTTLLAEPLRPAPPLAAPVEPKADVPAPASTAGSDISSGLGNDFVSMAEIC